MTTRAARKVFVLSSLHMTDGQLAILFRVVTIVGVCPVSRQPHYYLLADAQRALKGPALKGRSCMERLCSGCACGNIHVHRPVWQERLASGELDGAAGLLPLKAAARAGGLNWSELYAIVGSLFESNMSVPQHLAMLDHLPREQRCAVSWG